MTATCSTPGKSRYATQSAAEAAAHRAAIGVGQHLRAYSCHCGWWHLTKSKANRRRKSDA